MRAETENGEARRCLSRSSGYEAGQVKVDVPARRRHQNPAPGNCVNVTIRILLGIAMLISVTNFMVKMYINLGPEHPSVFYMVCMECVAVWVGGYLFLWETE
ncbi:uncharacterized protein LOC112269886 [Brachypodium distachyon]|uniref:Uncharacterized protein n=1 Tax=Brachypodium distachyon TaxID=15368 RepID=A0A0Q3NCU4_BRADI|nr:uncharacterized protein LOC112269886 [Brachypodium distachyon]KQK14822.2 hypothetical protein BRADI_1g18796v3 [Brachypodium distachyon]|eukprot:XP_024313117.1 uncharacterized protein LOC112269886 [Brachypodium distachyon]